MQSDNTKHVGARRSSVLNLPLRLVFPDYVNEVIIGDRENVELSK